MILSKKQFRSGHASCQTFIRKATRLQNLHFPSLRTQRCTITWYKTQSISIKLLQHRAHQQPRPKRQALPHPPKRILWNIRWKQKVRQRPSASELRQAPTKRQHCEPSQYDNQMSATATTRPHFLYTKLELPKFSNTCSVLLHLISPREKNLLANQTITNSYFTCLAQPQAKPGACRS